MTAPARVETPQQTDDDLWHVVCDCDTDVAMCGALVPGKCWTDEGLPCVVCEDLDQRPCERCGA